MKKIGILTSGGDAPGMNAAIWAAVKRARSFDMTILGVQDGYRGLLERRVEDLTNRDLSDIMHRGGTFLGTARCLEMLTEEGRSRAVHNIHNYGIEGLIVIGGDGSFRGAEILSERGVPTVGLPGTIDNDLAYTDYSIGFDTACNTAIGEVMKIRDTMTSHDRVAVIEVMGRHCGDIALTVSLAMAADYVLLPEVSYETEYDIDNLSNFLLNNKKKGRDSSIIIMAEGANWNEKNRAEILMNRLTERTGLDIRATVLGHTQRGGPPSAFDSRIAILMGVRAVELLREGMGNRVVGISENRIIDMNIKQALDMPPRFNEELYSVARMLSIN
ncbi:MAG: ATP-dependent 6-phosphofructokinase [Christensenellales bacterium]|jgi:6-phosphofructokinase 1